MSIINKILILSTFLGIIGNLFAVEPSLLVRSYVNGAEGAADATNVTNMWHQTNHSVQAHRGYTYAIDAAKTPEDMILIITSMSGRQESRTGIGFPCNYAYDKITSNLGVYFRDLETAKTILLISSQEHRRNVFSCPSSEIQKKWQDYLVVNYGNSFREAMDNAKSFAEISLGFTMAFCKRARELANTPKELHEIYQFLSSDETLKRTPLCKELFKLVPEGEIALSEFNKNAIEASLIKEQKNLEIIQNRIKVTQKMQDPNPSLSDKLAYRTTGLGMRGDPPEKVLPVLRTRESEYENLVAKLTKQLSELNTLIDEKKEELANYSAVIPVTVKADGNSPFAE
ncbi:MAG: hypothetical protein HQM10_25130 [Candidatus Riflebacteria bacterium]|nr:hypothetical protein [Candidatus Riflebacteria bacterium]